MTKIYKVSVFRLLLFFATFIASSMNGMENRRPCKKLKTTHQSPQEKLLAEVLEKNNNNFQEALFEAALEGYAEIIGGLINLGANVNAKNEDDKASLHLAVMFDRTQTVQALIEHGADIGIQDDDGWTPLHSVDKVEMAQVLIEHGVDIEARNKDGQTPLHVTGLWANIELAKTLLLADQQKTKMQLLDSQSRIFTLLCLYMYHEEFSKFPHELVKVIIANYLKDISNAEMLINILPFVDREKYPQIVEDCPCSWFVPAVQKIPSDKKELVIEEIIKRRIKEATKRCELKNHRDETASDVTTDIELKRLFDPSDQSIREAFIREKIRSEFAEIEQ